MDTRKSEQHNADQRPRELVESLVNDGVIGANETEFWTPLAAAAHTESAAQKVALDRIAYAVTARAAANADAPVGVSASAERNAFRFLTWSSAAILVIVAFAAGFAVARWTANSHDASSMRAAVQAPMIEHVVVAQELSKDSDMSVEAAMPATDSLPEGLWLLSENVSVKQLRIDTPLRIEAKSHPIRVGQLMDSERLNQS